MGFKHQLVCATSPTDLTQITINHLKAIKRIVPNRSVCLLIDDAINLTMERIGTGEAERRDGGRDGVRVGAKGGVERERERERGRGRKRGVDRGRDMRDGYERWKRERQFG
jgi:hypothetical protein